MEFVNAIPVMFKEITPNYYTSEKWKEVVLNTGKNFNSSIFGTKEPVTKYFLGSL